MKNNTPLTPDQLKDLASMTLLNMKMISQAVRAHHRLLLLLDEKGVLKDPALLRQISESEQYKAAASRAQVVAEALRQKLGID